MKGRPRKPSPFLVSRRRNSPGKEPELPSVKLLRPANLSEDAIREWEQAIQPLIDLGVVSANDLGGAVALCEAWSRYINAIRNLKDQGDVLEGEKGSYVNPNHRIQKDALADYMKLCPQFGIFPANRSRVTAATEQGKLDKDKGRFFAPRIAK